MSVSVSAVEDPSSVGDADASIRIVYLFTTFPKSTERFLQREIRTLRRLPVSLEVYSLWGGEREFEGLAIHRYPKATMVVLLWWLPYWLIRKPAAFARLVAELARGRAPSWKNFGETLVGIAFALSHARAFERQSPRPDLVHAAWATMPATAALVIHRLTGLRFTMGAHAYDVFQDGGDWLLSVKLGAAARVIATTYATKSELVRRGAPHQRVAMVSSGLFPMPELGPCRSPRETLRILSVGRLVEKKGLPELISMFAEMRQRGILFEARVVGEGGLRRTLEGQIQKLGVAPNVTLTGSLPFDGVLDELAWADVLVFTGKIAGDGDRDGLPNVLLEAMATGTPVVTTDVAGIPELVEDGTNGVLLSTLEPDAWIRALLRLRDDEVFYRRLRREGRASVEARHDARATSRRLLAEFLAVK